MAIKSLDLLRVSLAVTVLLVSTMASASYDDDDEADIAASQIKVWKRESDYIKKLMGKRYELAGAYKRDEERPDRIEKRRGDDYYSAVSGNYEFLDLNRDGRTDLVAAVEEEPRGNAFGSRQLLVYLRSAEGKLTLVAGGSGVLLRADQGDHGQDPLSSIEANGSGSFAITHARGQEVRLSTLQRFALREGKILLVGLKETRYHVKNEMEVEIERNLINGARIVRTTVNDEISYTKGRDKVRKLKTLQTVQLPAK